MKKFLSDLLKVVIALIVGGTVVYRFKINIPINSDNPTYRVYAQNAFINESGQLTINGIVKDAVTGDSVTFASQAVVRLEKNQ